MKRKTPSSLFCQCKSSARCCSCLLEQIGMLAASIQVPQNVSAVSPKPSPLPSYKNWPGKFGFDAAFSYEESDPDRLAWSYSSKTEKLYVAKSVPCAVNFSVNSVLPDNVYIRAMALFSSPEHSADIVQRCVTHSIEEIQKGIYEAEHLIRCENSKASYQVDRFTGRHSVIVPFGGKTFSTYTYKFACFGSCSGGPNRRPLMVVFTLEIGGIVIGQRTFHVKICALPSRDKKYEERRFEKEEKKKGTLSETFAPITYSDEIPVTYSPSDEPEMSPKKDGLYTITVKDYGCFSFLQQMKTYYEIYGMLRNTPFIKKT
ncbi:cellular tumor antigen p53-like [Stegodyphus dumicola]|uniref:cellular tumor antigen p53-like n=1 Tax=Stegodyphus dumicola TaxID=202533 RepID=UPI0015A8B9FB|nr:cellular tumor antigen p53-like [Stegodyphus dumicola]